MADVVIKNLSPDKLRLTGAEPAGAEVRARQYTDEKVGAIAFPAAPTLTDLGGEPKGAEARAKQYTDEKVGAIAFPAAPTLTDLGGEPKGAEARAKQYTDEKVGAIAFPAAPTLTDLGGEPKGAEARAKQYTDEKFKSPTWIPVTGFQNGWSNYGGLPNAQFSVDCLKIVRFMGVIRGPATSGLPISTLPVGFRPLSLKGWRAFSSDPLAYLLILPTGEILVNCTAAGGEYIYLDNIVFPVY